MITLYRVYVDGQLRYAGGSWDAALRAQKRTNGIIHTYTATESTK